MHLTDHDLKQIHQEYLASLSSEQLLHISEKMLDDLRNARDRLNQTPQNSSRPSGSYAPWEQESFSNKKNQSDGAEKETSENAGKETKSESQTDASTEQSQSDDQANNRPGSKRNPGKQPEANGIQANSREQRESDGG